jgi:hypothetical protein
MLEKIAQSAANIYAGKDWHSLNENEHQLVEQLVEANILHETSHGFVGEQKK